MSLPKELIDQIFAHVKTADDLKGPDGVLWELTGALVERMLEAELTEHLGYEKGDPAGRGTGNSRNGRSSKTLVSDRGNIPIEVPRDRDGSFEPQLVPKRSTHFDLFDDAILSMYSRGMSVREIQGHVKELYGVDVSPTLISRVTESALEDVQAWRGRPLDPLWPVVILDAIVLKVREKGAVRNKCAYIALGIDLRGHKEVLGLWLEGAEGAKTWLSILTELKSRGVEDILIACCDGLKGFPEAIEAVFPRTTVQTCIVHMIRSSLRYTSWKDRKRLASELRPIYTAENREGAEAALDAFEDKWGRQYPQIIKVWRSSWERVVPFLDFPPAIRKVIYTTNAIESLNASLRKVTTPKGHFPTDEAAIKLLYLAILNRQEKWTRPVQGWAQALQYFTLYFEGRIPV